MRGLFITLEGIEGSGKSTQIALLADHLRTAGHAVTQTREPGGTPIGDQVRKVLLDPANRALDPRAELLLYAASRSQHLAEKILPAIASGTIVLCDRFSDATIAYQGYGRGLDIGTIRALDQIVTGGLSPHLTILLDLDVTTGLSRARGRNDESGLQHEGRFENEAVAFHERVRKGYLTLARQEPERIRIVDAGRAPEMVQEDIRRALDVLLRQDES